MDKQGILGLEARRYAAMTAVDVPELEALLHDDLVYTHSSGVIDTKQSYIEALTSGRTRYVHCVTHDQQVRIIGDVALVVAGSHIDVVVPAGPKSLDLRSLAVWTATPRGWQFVAWQSCAIKL